MNRKASGPRPDALVGRVEAFFRANPDEWLTIADGAAKFGCTEAQFRKAVVNLRLYGWSDLELVSVVRVKA